MAKRNKDGANKAYADYQRWKKSVLGSEFLIHRDGLDTTAAESLLGETRETAIRMLLFGVNTGDSYAALTLAAMGETSAIPQIRDALSTSDGGNKVHFAQAIHNLTSEDSSSDSMAKELVEVLNERGGHYSNQITAAIGLRDFGDAASEHALLNAVEHDEEYLVRYHCCESLLSRWRVDPPNFRGNAHSEIFEDIVYPRDGNDITDVPTRRRDAIVRLEKLRNSDE